MVTGQYSELEWKLRDLTNSDPWGCSLTDMQAFIDDLRHEEERNEVLESIQRRLGDGWRNRYKALNVLDHILKHGPVGFLTLVEERKGQWVELLSDLKTNYEFTDEKGKDQGINVRLKSTSILYLLTDPALLTRTRREEQDRRELMIKRRQEFQQHGNSAVSISSNESVVGKVEAYQELARSSPSQFGNGTNDAQPKKQQEVKRVTPLTQTTGNLLDDPIECNEDDFDDFQSAPSSTIVSPSAEQAKDPFEDLLKL